MYNIKYSLKITRINAFSFTTKFFASFEALQLISSIALNTFLIATDSLSCLLGLLSDTFKS